MTQSPEPAGPAAPAAKQPYGPGLMMLFGLGLLIVGVFCGWDTFFPPKGWAQENWKVWFNAACMVGGAIGAIYCFAMAVVRSRKAAPPADGTRPPEAGA